jgi:hypothetical protein
MQQFGRTGALLTTVSSPSKYYSTTGTNLRISDVRKPKKSNADELHIQRVVQRGFPILIRNVEIVCARMLYLPGQATKAARDDKWNNK